MEQIKKDKTILLISKDKNLLSVFKNNISLRNYEIIEANSNSSALTIIEKTNIDIVFFDLEINSNYQIDIVNFIKKHTPHCEIVVLTTTFLVEKATLALNKGAAFYLIKPIEKSCLDVIIKKLRVKLDRQEQYLDLERRVLDEMMSGNKVIKKILTLTLKIAPTSSTVLIEGDSGTGKEFFAKIIHRMSRRVDGPFVAVNCGAIPENLFESEMFGHKKGSFTGAHVDKVGLVEEANLGTLFLDEVGELPLSLQVKLLRFLQERTFRRIGETDTRSVDVRIIAATNKDLSKLIEEGKFREDLFYRLNVFRLYLPPLKQRKETIPFIIKMLIHKHNISMNKNVEKVNKYAEAILAKYDYPGNIRELENIIEHAMALAEGNEITPDLLPEFLFEKRIELMAPQKDYKFATLAEVEKNHISRALSIFENNYTNAAKSLGISRSTLWRKIKEYKLNAGEMDTEPV